MASIHHPRDRDWGWRWRWHDPFRAHRQEARLETAWNGPSCHHRQSPLCRMPHFHDVSHERWGE